MELVGAKCSGIHGTADDDASDESTTLTLTARGGRLPHLVAMSRSNSKEYGFALLFEAGQKQGLTR
ncbi:MAG: hypothetical protein OXG22_13310 [Chloroflexi bacterium]|nr:hypothetical protein [Chloroflexota bacterium]